MEKLLFKIDLLGEEGAGKLALVDRLVKNHFYVHEKPPSRIGTGLSIKRFTVNEDVIELLILPPHYMAKTASGGDIFYFRPPFFSHGLILVYDITDEQSLYKLEGWIEPIRERVEELDISMVFAGCKTDLEEHRSVSKEDALAFANKLELQIDDVIECSAKTGENVEELFLVLISRMLSRFKD